jgi:hypothetical protein
MLAAEEAVRAWLNDPATGLLDGTGGGVMARGAYLRSQRSPADGAYCVLATSWGGEAGVAEPTPALQLTRVTFRVFAGTEEAAERAAAALATAVAGLTGVPVRCGQTSTWLRGHDLLTGPLFVPAGPDAGEEFCFQVTAQLLLADYDTTP